MPEYRLATRVGTLVFEIEPSPEIEDEPEDSQFRYAVWEKMIESPEDDEIVETFSTQGAAENWINEILTNPTRAQNYLISRGLQ